MIIYTDANQPELPREVGGWIELKRIEEEGTKPTWRVRFENAVGVLSVTASKPSAPPSHTATSWNQSAPPNIIHTLNRM